MESYNQVHILNMNCYYLNVSTYLLEQYVHVKVEELNLHKVKEIPV